MGNYSLPLQTETCTIDAKVTKTIGAFSVNAGLYDILNSKNSIQRVISDNYYEDQTRLHLGRHFLIGLRWNFGKMNPIPTAPKATCRGW